MDAAGPSRIPPRPNAGRRAQVDDDTQKTLGNLVPDQQQADQQGGELEDSDQEFRAPPKQHRFGKIKAHGKQRRCTIKPADTEEGVILRDVAAGAILYRVENTEEFIDSVNDRPDDWRSGIKGMVVSVIELTGRNENLSRDLGAARINERVLSRQVTEATQRLSNQEAVSARLRGLRDKYRQEMVNKELELVKLRRRLQEHPNEAQQEDHDSDQDEFIAEIRRRHGHRLNTMEPENPQNLRTPEGHRRHRTPATDATSVAIPGSNKRYPNVPDFHGTQDKDIWDSWRLHLLSKFRQSAVLYPTEQDKIEYIRDKCKSTAFDVIKTRADPINEQPYKTAEEMIQDLHNMFGEFNKIARSDAELHDPKFAIRASDSKENFNSFFARFTAAVAPLNYSEVHKISTLKRLISSRLRYKVSDGTAPTSYRQFVERLRQCDLDLRQADNANNGPSSRGSGRGGRGGRGGGSTGQTPASSRPSTFSKPATSGDSNYRHPIHVLSRLRKENRCFKCLQQGHRPTDEKAPCKTSPYLTKEQVTSALATFGIEVDEDEGNLTTQSEN